MENIILSGMLRDFSARFVLATLPEQQQFEHFVNYSSLSSDHYDSFDLERVSTGDCIGVDGAAVVISGAIIDEPTDAERLTSARFEAEFHFIQSKTSTKFDLGDFLKFTSTVGLFFGEDEEAVPPQLRKAFRVKKIIFDRASKLRALPHLNLVYAYAGTFNRESTGLGPQFEEEDRKLSAIRGIGKVRTSIVDANQLAGLFRETRNETEKEIPFSKNLALPSIPGATNTYIGVVSCKDYVALISKENGELNKSLFFENVRDFLGARNIVNDAIETTILNPDEKNQFAVLNNGVTIVAKRVHAFISGDKFRLSRFQIVNGCQSSHVLHRNAASLSSDMHIAVKIIETSDVDLTTKIIATTNSQTIVSKEAFAAIRPYHRKLEDYFDAMRGVGYSYHYERRPHQYDEEDHLRQSQIVSTPNVIKSFVSVILEEPHKVHYYYGSLLEEYNKNKSRSLFAEDDYPGLYFAAHHLSARVRRHTWNDAYLKPWGFHIALLVKRLLAPQLRKGRAITDRDFLEIVQRVDREFDGAYKIACEFLEGANPHPDKTRAPDATKAMLDEFMRATSSNSTKPPSSIAAPPTPVLPDGTYIFTVESNSSTTTLAVKYGPFSFDVVVADAFRFRIGQRVPVQVSGAVANLVNPSV